MWCVLRVTAFSVVLSGGQAQQTSVGNCSGPTDCTRFHAHAGLHRLSSAVAIGEVGHAIAIDVQLFTACVKLTVITAHPVLIVVSLTSPQASACSGARTSSDGCAPRLLPMVLSYVSSSAATP